MRNPKLNQQEKDILTQTTKILEKLYARCDRYGETQAELTLNDTKIIEDLQDIVQDLLVDYGYPNT